MNKKNTDRVSRPQAEKERGLLEQDYAFPCPECGGVVFEWWDSDICRDCVEEQEEPATEQATLIPDGGVIEDDAECCIWCEEETELVDDECATSYLVAGPDGDVLEMGYGLVCPDCWNSIREQWRQDGELTKPLSRYGNVSA